MLGLDDSEWTAIGTIGLVIVTLVYVVLTAYIAKKAATSAKSAETSATGALRAAQAAERATVLAEAGLNIDFVARYDEMAEGPCLFLTSLGSRVIVDGAEFGGVLYLTNGEKQEIRSVELDWMAPNHGPERVHKGELLMFHWPTSGLDLSKQNVGFVRIGFRIAEGDPKSRIDRPVEFQSLTQEETTEGLLTLTELIAQGEALVSSLTDKPGRDPAEGNAKALKPAVDAWAERSRSILQKYWPSEVGKFDGPSHTVFADSFFHGQRTAELLGFLRPRLGNLKAILIRVS